MAGESKALRRYHTIVERALSLFDPSSEWADHIAFLGRLAKAITTGRPEGETEIPLKASIAKCLSQCLQPSLPAGVHQKALEIYDLIFSITGTAGLSKDLQLYLPGLSHTLAFANLSTRPLILGLYEDYILKLSSQVLRPASKAIVLSLLPALEEETSEDFDRTMAVFEAFRKGFRRDGQESFFWQTLFVASISSSNRRPGVLVYLTRHLPRLTRSAATDIPNGSSPGHYPMAPEANTVVTPEPGLLVRCFATGLRDEQPLVQRGFLDLLVTHLPLDAPIFATTTHAKDVDVLVRAASMVVLRRDMGLNRRLWAWFTGTDGKNAQALSPAVKEMSSFPTQTYFNEFAYLPLVRSLQEMINTDSLEPTVKARPFRVALSLMDRWDIGGPIVASTFLPMLQSLHSYQASAPSQTAFDEVFRSANVFFDGVESGLVFNKFSELLQNHKVDLILFIIGNFNFEDAEIQATYLPFFCLEVAKTLLQEPTSVYVNAIAQILDELLSFGPSIDRLDEDKQVNENDSSSSILGTVATVYLGDAQRSENSSNVASLCTSLERCMLLTSNLAPLSQLHFCDQMIDMLEQQLITEKMDLSAVVTAAKIVSSLKMRDMDQEVLTPDLWSTILHLLIRNLWNFLKPSTPQYHVAVTEDIWRLHDLSKEMEIVESAILSLILQPAQKSFEPDTSASDKFGVFWTHSRSIRKFPDDRVPDLLIRPLLHIVDTTNVTNQNNTERRWLSSLPSPTPVLNAILSVPTGTQQSIALTLTRLDRLVRLLKVSPQQWTAFLDSSDFKKVQELCLALIQPSDEKDDAIRYHALSLVKEIYNTEHGGSIPEDVSALLVERLYSPTESEEIREAILDTLLAVLSEHNPTPGPLLSVLLSGIASSASDMLLDKQITLLCNSLPQYATLLPNLLKITETFCKRAKKGFNDLQELYDGSKTSNGPLYPERSVLNVLSGMEYVLARAHQQVSIKMDADQGGASGSGAEANTGRAFANDHLTVVLCMQDAVKVCAQLWGWRASGRSTSTTRSNNTLVDVKSFQYMALKLRSRTRRILENLIEAEPQECLETLISLRIDNKQTQVLELLQSLDGARPKFMMPATFNAIYSRTNPTALDRSQKSSLSVEVRPLDLITFLNDYISALEDDLLEEIWTDCTTFLREVLANPMPHRQLLIKLLEFSAVLCKKMENTNFGESHRMRRELADLSARLFTAIFTIKPAGFDGGTIASERDPTSNRTRSTSIRRDGSNALQVFSNILPALSTALIQADRLVNVCNGIALHITGPMLHSRLFPQNISPELLDLLKWMSLTATTTKFWKKDATDAFNSPRFFQSDPVLISGWLPLVRQLSLNEKGLMPELLNRIAPPAAAGLMFGVGATAARNEADRKTQVELRRICFLTLSGEEDSFVPHLRQLLLKVEELIGATPESSPSSATRGDLYLVLRTLLLTFSQDQLPALWPLLDSELREFCEDMLKDEPSLNKFSRLQGAKLLDLLLLLRPDEFQLHEWLFVNDTIDAVYPPNNVRTVSYADLIAPHLHSTTNAPDVHTNTSSNIRKPWLCVDQSRDADKVDALLAGFFSQLSIRVFEDIYTLQGVDLESCRQDLLIDLFTDMSGNAAT